MVVAVGGNNGGVALYQLTALIVHGLFQERYAFRDVITDVVVQEMVTDQKVRIKCKELVKKISVYREKLAVQLNERILVYSTDVEETNEPAANSNNDLKFKLLKKINRKVDCSLLVVTSSYIILCLEQKLQMLSFSGDLVREWILESLIRYIKVLGGPEKRETLLVGLKNGKVLKIFTDNSFPIVLINQNVPIRCLDMSQSRKRLAVVDDNSNLTVYDMITKESIFSEINVTSVAFNTDMDELLAYSGKGLLYIKTENFPATSQKMNGFVVGFKGAKLFVLHYLNMSTLDVPQTYSLLKYIEKKQFNMAYKLACLGITDQDFKLLGIEALKYGEIKIAKKCFIRTKDFQFLELALKYEKEYENGQCNPIFLQAEVLAYQGKYEQAANLYVESGFPEYASRLFEDLQDFDKALMYIKNTGQGTDGIESRQRDIQKGQADMLQETDYRRAAKIYNSIGLYGNSIQLLIKKNDREGLAEVCRLLNKNDHLKLLYKCALFFKTQKLYEYAKEAYMKLGDQKALVELGIQFEQWEYALFLAKQQPEFMKILYLPYAEFLTKSDRFEDAIQVYKKLGRTDLTQKILSKLSENATVEARFRDASYYFWILAVEFLSHVKNAIRPDGDDDHNLRKWEEFNRISNIYYAYSSIYEFVESPFQESSGMSYYMTIFNAARFIISQSTKDQLPVGVSKVYIYLALAKVSKILEAYKTTRICYDKLKTLKIPSEWTEEVELSNLLIRSKPFQDKDNLQSLCNRCMQQIPIIQNENRCQSCKQPLMQSFVSFEVLPLVEFQVAKNITQQKFQELIYEEKDPHEKERIKKLREKERAYDDDGWTETQYGNEQTLQFNQKQFDDDIESTPFFMKMNEVCEQQVANEDYIPIVLDEDIIKTLNPEEVFAVDYTKYCQTMPIKYYKTMVPEIAVEVCKKCCRFFILDEYEFEFLKNQCCVFCRAKENEVQF
eukprot:TRINITY_DN678_c0_g1_i2.p1 TRINITY_DN678_c0_g1~~TRINITY_DN678_c0_g1_i2.p1  ORF type:complete len:953 (-),score=153.20 TRINITY_DN678_c0_g1_i2:31-2889(-)